MSKLVKLIENSRPTFNNLAQVAVELGYKNPFQQLILTNGCSVSDVIDFFEDNPGAVEAVFNWIIEEGCTIEGEKVADLEEEEIG